MTKEEVYDIWRPSWSPWSPWVKPVLFAFLTENELRSKSADPTPREWSVPRSRDIAIAIDLPGADSILAGVALASSGYRPVPVFNACPYPPSEVSNLRMGHIAVDLLLPLQIIAHGAVALAATDLPTAPTWIDLYVALAEPEASPNAFQLAREARRAGLSAQLELAGRSLKGQLKQADRLGARYVAIVGNTSETILKEMESGEQRELPAADVIPNILRGRGRP